MLKINCILFYICVCWFALPMSAQQLDAKSILDRTSANFRNAGGVKAAFTVRASDGNTTGTIRLKGDKFLWEADGMTTWFDGRTQWSYLASADEVNVSEPTPQELQSINPYAFLSLYKQGYKEALEKMGNSQDSSLYKVVLTSTSRKQELQCIIFYIAKNTFRPVRISMTQRGGDTVEIIINSYQTGQTYPDTLFVFDKKAYPKAEVIDLR